MKAIEAILHCLIGYAVSHSLAIAQPANRLTGNPEPALWRRAEHLRSTHRESLQDLPADKSRVFTLDRQEWERTRSKAPPESAVALRRSPALVSLPMPDGSFQRFRVVESPVMAPELAARFPQIKTYVGQGIDDSTATVRLDSTPSGLHAQVLARGHCISIEPLAGEAHAYATYDTRDLGVASARCETTAMDLIELQPGLLPAAVEPAFKAAAVLPGSTVTLRTYRLAIAASGEFTVRYGGTVESALAAIVTMVNRLNGVYETEFAFRMQLIANNHLIIYTNAATDPYSVGDTAVTASQSQMNLDTVIGSANYDLGQVFTTTGGGRAAGGACLASSKGACTSGFPRFTAGSFEISTFLHEMGHQFGTPHTWNGSGCPASEYRQPAAYEPGSGSTIMSYAGNCSSGNFQILRDSYFHSISLDNAFSHTVPGGRNNCAVLTVTDNTPPIVNAGRHYIIPGSTPFVLIASGLDPDGDALTFCWEQRDVGLAQSNPGSDIGSGPLFRSFAPSTSPTRTFPQLPDLLANRNSIAEVLPTQSRTLHFRITARDNRAGGGGIGGDDTEVLVIANAGPFLVTAPNSAVTWSGSQTITWSVAGTSNAPINALAVNIRLSTNGGWDFPFLLATNTPNDGSETLLLPSVYTTQARIKVEAVDNIFFDVSNTNFTVLPFMPVISGAGTRLVAESCSPADGAIDPGETVTVSFVLQNIGPVGSSNLMASLVPTDDILFPSGLQTIGNLAPQARSTNSFSFISHAGLACGGTITAFVEVTDGSSDFGRVEFPLTIGNTAFTTNRFANNNRITIADYGAGSPYPSSIDVSGLAGEVAAVRVTLSNMNHVAWGEVDVLLAGPEGRTVLLVSETGAYGNYSGVTLTFDDAALSPLSELGAVISGVFKPSNYFNDDIFPSPAPEGPYGEKLSVFQNANPNGTWQLFVVDDWEAQDAGSINGGWSLQIVTAQNDCCQGMPPLNDLSLSMRDTPNPIDVGEVLTYTLTVSNSGPLSASQVVLTNFLSPTLTNILINASQGACSNGSGIVICDIGALAGGANALIMISGQPTVRGAITNRATVTRAGTDGSMANNTAHAVTFVQEILLTVQDATVFEGDSGGKNLSFSARLSGASLVPVSVNYATADGTAMAGSDYIATNGVLTFLPGQTNKTITVRVLGDLLVEADETFFLHLSNAQLAASTVVGTIRNDDVEVSISDVSVREGNKETRDAQFLVTLSGPNSKTVTVNFATTNGTAQAGSDYATVSGRLVFAPGQTTAPVSVAISGDLQIESTRRSV